MAEEVNDTPIQMFSYFKAKQRLQPQDSDKSFPLAGIYKKRKGVASTCWKRRKKCLKNLLEKTHLTGL